MSSRVSKAIPFDLPARGAALYEQGIRSQVEPREYGKFVVIDIFSGDYEVDIRDADATSRLLDRHPDAMTWAVRVGHPTPYVWLSKPLTAHD